MNQSTTLKLATLSFLAGMMFLLAAPFYGWAAHNAPADPRTPGILEIVYGFPAFAFTIAGIAGVVLGILLIAKAKQSE